MSFAACVIGAGPAGIAAAVGLRRVGAMVTCFEIHREIGGLWNANGNDQLGFRGINSPIHSSMRAVIPKDLMCFSDRRMNFFVPNFPHHTAVKNYLQDYSCEKGIAGLVRFNTKIERIRKDHERNCWIVTSVNFTSGDVYEWRFDCVVVASGRTAEPRFPEETPDGEFDFLDNGGNINHVSNVKEFRKYFGKRVIVAGDGVAAYEHCKMLAEHGAEVFHSTMIQPSKRDPSENTDKPKPKGREALTLANVLNNMPFDKEHSHKGREVLCRWLRDRSANVDRIPRVGKITSYDGNKTVTCEVDPTQIVTEEQKRLLSGKLKKQAVDFEKWKEEHKDIAEDETLEDSALDMGETVQIEGIDEVIYATGYHLQFPFLPEDIREKVEAKPLLRLMEQSKKENPDAEAEALEAQLKEDLRNGTAIQHRGLFMGCVYIDDPTIAFVGLPNDLIPPFAIFEAQAKYIAGIMAHRISLPPDEGAMREYEKDFTSIYSSRGAGTDSIPYFNALHHACQSRHTFQDEVMSRRLWFAGTWALKMLHKFRELAPLKRKKQHIIISNKI